MPVATLFQFYWSAHLPALTLEGGGIVPDALLPDNANIRLEDIYIPSKTVFYAVYRGEIMNSETHFHDAESPLSDEGEISAAELREFFSRRNYGEVFYAATRPARETAARLKLSRQGFSVSDLQPIRKGALVGTVKPSRNFGLARYARKNASPIHGGESFNSFRERFVPKIMSIARMGYQGNPPIVILHTGGMMEIRRLFGDGATRPLVRPGGVIEVFYDHAANRLRARAAHRKLGG